MRRGSSSTFIYAFLDLGQHVSASYCYHQGVVVFSKATQPVCIVAVYGLWPLQSGQFSRNQPSVYSVFCYCGHRSNRTHYTQVTNLDGP
jgi:hypothetical protein